MDETHNVSDEEIAELERRLGLTQPNRSLKLRPRELEVLRCLSHGLTVEMAAEVMGCAFETAKNHAKNARYCLGAKNQAHAIAIAIRKGLIP